MQDFLIFTMPSIQPISGARTLPSILPYNVMPVQLNVKYFQQYILPYLTLPKRGPHCKIGYCKLFNYILKVLYTGMQWKALAIERDTKGKAEILYTVIYKRFAQWCHDGSFERVFIASIRHLKSHGKLDLSVLHGDGSNTVAKKGGDGIGYSGHKHQTGEKIIAIADHHGYILSPVTVAPVNQSDTVLLPQGLRDLCRIARAAGLRLKGAVLNLDAGFDSKHNRKTIFNNGMIPNINENPRNQKILKPGRKRFFDGALYALRFTIERVFSWEDKFKRVVLRYEIFQQRHLGFKLMAFTLINLREFCRT